MPTPYIGVYADSYPAYTGSGGGGTTPGGDQAIALQNSDAKRAVFYPDANVISSFATYQLSSDSPYLNIDLDVLAQTVGLSQAQGAAVYVNRVYDGRTNTGSARGITRYTFTAAPSGQRTIELVTCGQERPNDQGDAYGSRIYSVQGAPGTSTSKVAPTKKAKRVYAVGDSLQNGHGSDNAQQDAWPRQLMAMDSSYEVTLEGAGFHSASVSYGSAAQQQGLVQRALEYLAGANEAHFIINLQVNDFISQFGTAAYVSGIIGNIIDAIHAARPSVIIHVVTAYPIGASREPGLQAYRDALSGLNNDVRNTWLRIVYGEALTTASKLAGDQVHFPRAGYTDIAAGILAALPAQPTGPVTTPTTPEGSLITALNGTTQAYWEVQNSQYTNFLGVEPNLTMWVRIKPDSYSQQNFLMSKQVSLSGNQDWTLGLYMKNSSVYFEFFNGSVTSTLSTAFPSGIQAGQECIVIIRYTPSTVTLYVGSNTVSMPNPGGDLFVSAPTIQYGGIFNPSGELIVPFAGSMRNAGIVKRAYADAEINALFSSGGVPTAAQIAEDSMLGFWPMTRVDDSTTLSINRKSGRSLLELKSYVPPVISPTMIGAGETVQETDSRFTYNGDWTPYYNAGDPANYGNGRYFLNSGKNGYVQWVNGGTSFTHRYAAEPYGGSVDVLLVAGDGSTSLLGSYSQYAASETPATVYTSPTFPAGSTIRVQKTNVGDNTLLLHDQITSNA